MRLPSVLLAIWILLGLAVAAPAQFTFPAPTQEDPPKSSTAANPSPRDAFSAFINAMAKDDLRGARQTMDLSHISFSIREAEGNRAAQMLLAIIDKAKPLKLEEIPEQLEENSFVWYEGDDLGRIELMPDSRGTWKFTEGTVDSLDELFQSFRDKPSLNGLTAAADPLQEPSDIARGMFSDEWLNRVLLLELWQWTLLAALVSFSLVIVPIARLLVTLILKLRLRVLRDKVTDGSLKGMKGAAGALAVSLLWLWGLPYIGLPLTAEAVAFFVLKILWGIAIAWTLFALFDVVIDIVGNVGGGAGARAEHVLIPVVRKFGKFIIVVGTILFVATSFDVNLAGVIAGLGIGGLVIALASKDSVENLFGSLTILFDMPFGIGDWVKIGEIDGVVEQINLRSTRIRTFEDSVITLPNSNLIKASVENLGARRYRRMRTKIGIAVETHPDQVAEFTKAIRAYIEDHPKIRKGINRAFFNEMGDSSLDVLFYNYLDVADYQEELVVREEILLEIMRIAERIGVNFAFPTQTMYLQGPEPGAPLSVKLEAFDGPSEKKDADDA